MNCRFWINPKSCNSHFHQPPFSMYLKTYLKAGITVFLTVFLLFSSQAQVLVNLEWNVSSGVPSDEVDYSTSVIDGAGDLIIAGNTFVNGESTNFLVSKVQPDGTKLWEYE